MDPQNLTPAIKQYMEIKKLYPDAILFFRMGDFYEMFFEDARTAAPILEVVLTSRNKSKDNAIPLCGIPYHAMENYAAKLLRQGYKVAICDQVEDPKFAKGIVRREVTRILTPATALEIENGSPGAGNYVVAAFADEKSIALASMDLSVSDFEVKCFAISNRDSFFNDFFRKAPREVVVARRQEDEADRIRTRFPELDHLLITVQDDDEFNYPECENVLKQQLRLENIEGLGLADYPSAVIAAGALLKYLHSVRRTALKNVSSLRFTPEENYLILDAVSFRNLEILVSLRTGNSRGTLFDAVDSTITAMGKRLLKKWLAYPLVDVAEIEKRLDGVDEFFQNLIVRSEIRKTLKYFADLARLNSRISLNIAQPLHLLQLKETLEKIPDIRRLISGLKSGIAREIAGDLDELAGVSELIGRAIADDPPASIAEGQVIRRGFHRELDELRGISRNAKEIISELERSEREKTGIGSLKIKYNRVFGYFIEVTNPHLKLVPPRFIRKQTLVNAERFLTPELKELEEKILKAEEKIFALEKDLYFQVLGEIQKESLRLNLNSERIALLDVLAGGGELAQRRNYSRPELDRESAIVIQDGRHPVLESSAMLHFIPNDLTLSSDRDQILIVTGPNMGGKSTYLRQNALIVILAQAGYFVPARKARIGIVDRIFTRIGAADSLLEGKSTFMVEMIEAAIILNNATAGSLILLDEIGRGTSTYDGLSIAWAVIEYLHSLKARPRTLFATHYHELTELAEVLERVRNCHIAVKEWQENVIFLHKILPGATDQSFGIHVAKIAGIPYPVIERAKEILLNLEKKELNRMVKERITGRIGKVPETQKTLFPDELELKVWDEIRDKLKEIDISNLTPLEAMNILHFLKFKSENFK